MNLYEYFAWTFKLKFNEKNQEWSWSFGELSRRSFQRWEIESILAKIECFSGNLWEKIFCNFDAAQKNLFVIKRAASSAL